MERVQNGNVDPDLTVDSNNHLLNTKYTNSCLPYSINPLDSYTFAFNFQSNLTNMELVFNPLIILTRYYFNFHLFTTLLELILAVRHG